MTFEKEGAEARIIAIAAAMSGHSTPPEGSQLLFEAAAIACLNICGRGDVPYAMEPAVASVLAQFLGQDAAGRVQSIKRGDVAITYAKGGLQRATDLLAPFIKLRSVTM